MLRQKVVKRPPRVISESANESSNDEAEVEEPQDHPVAKKKTVRLSKAPAPATRQLSEPAVTSRHQRSSDVPFSKAERPKILRREENKPANEDPVVGANIVGVVYLKSGETPVYQTPSLKYFVISSSGSKTYVTDRVLSGKLPIYEAK